MKRLICFLTALGLGIAPATSALAAGGATPAAPESTPVLTGEALAQWPVTLPLRYAQADTMTSDAAPTAVEQAVSRPAPPKRLITANKLHQYLGIGALALGAATVLAVGTAGENEGGGEPDGGLHGALAAAATGAAVGAVATGFMYHREDVGFDEPLTDPDNLHMVLGALGAAGFAAATAMEGDEGHSTFGLVGGLSMLVAVKLAW